MRGHRIRRLGALLSLVACACVTRDMDVQVIRYPGAPIPPRPGTGCDVDLLGEDHFELVHCRDIGDVFVGDTGSSVECGRARVRREIHREACRAGANAVVIRRIHDPNSDCYNARARLLLCTEPLLEDGP